MITGTILDFVYILFVGFIDLLPDMPSLSFLSGFYTAGKLWAEIASSLPALSTALVTVGLILIIEGAIISFKIVQFIKK